MILSPLPNGSTFSLVIFLCLLAILAVSGWVFTVLTRLWTTHRPIQTLRDWAGDRNFKLQLPPDVLLPVSLDGLKPLDPRVELVLQSESIALIRLTTAAKPTSPRPIWHLLIRQVPQAWNPAGLRPAQAATSYLDLFSLNGFPSMLPPGQFVAMGADSRDAKQIAATPARGLLPGDIGLMVHGTYVTLDFSTRPFDAIEFERMLAIMEQVISAF